MIHCLGLGDQVQATVWQLVLVRALAKGLLGALLVRLQYNCLLCVFHTTICLFRSFCFGDDLSIILLVQLPFDILGYVQTIITLS